MIRPEELKGTTKDEVIDELRGSGYTICIDEPFTLEWTLDKELIKAGLRGKTVRYIKLTNYTDISRDPIDDTYTIVDVWDYIPLDPVAADAVDRVVLLRNGKYIWDLEK